MVCEITSHKVNGLNERLIVEALDEPGSGNACHVYEIGYMQAQLSGDVLQNLATLSFQQGGIAEAGVNGISIESLLAVIEHRLQGFQSGQFACIENAEALFRIQQAMKWLQKRTKDRTERGVEGTAQI